MVRVIAVVRVCGECVVSGIWCSLFVGFAFVVILVGCVVAVVVGFDVYGG